MNEMIQRILRARVYDVAVKTPIHPMPRLSEALGNQLSVKREDLQPIFSFKIRGAYNKIRHLSQVELDRGIIAASAGNHAQGVAISAQTLGITATIVMPVTTPSIKVDSVRARGVEVVLHGDSFDEACTHAHTLEAERGLTFIHPYDDPDVIAGQGTVAKEILEDSRNAIDAIFIPVGGGGLIAGMAAYIKAVAPEIKVIGVEPEDSNCLGAALAADERVVLPKVGIFADGVAVAQIGEHTWDLAKAHVDEVITANIDEICTAIKDLFDDTRAIAEPAGALAVAGMRRYVKQEGVEGKHLMAVLSGANMNFDRLRHVSERAEMGEAREGVFGVKIPEQPGSFRKFCQLLGRRSVTEFNYRYADDRDAIIFVGVQFGGDAGDRQALVDELNGAGYAVEDYTHNELAKLHVRHLVGGHASHIADERVLRFEFPERPGALRNFLDTMSDRWNISLFHYRNHGAAFGRVFMGIQVPDNEQADFARFLDDLGYGFVDESENLAYRQFLGR